MYIEVMKPIERGGVSVKTIHFVDSRKTFNVGYRPCPIDASAKVTQRTGRVQDDR
ncbi:MAG: hypothetical protein R2827_14490 [Bdellovibrionales bacterium]